MNFKGIFELAQWESSSLGGVSTIMDILWSAESGLVLKIFPDQKGNVVSIENGPANSNLFFIGTIDFQYQVFYTFSGKFLQNHVGHESDTK